MPATQVRDLPPEILLKVFLAFLGPRSDTRGGVEDLYRRRRPVLLTHICREWRAYALSYPFLWTDIQIHGTSELFLSFFERSHPLPVDLTVRASTYRSCSRITYPLHDKLKSLGEKHLRRIRSIAMLGMHRQAICDVLAAVDGMALPALEALSLRGREPADIAHGTHIPFLTHANSILSVTLSNFCISCIPCQQNLTTLELLTFPPGFGATALRGLIESFPALNTLVIGNMQGAWEQDVLPQVEPPIISAPNLKTLVVTPQAVSSRFSWGADIHQPCTPFCHCTFRNLIAENLEYLEVSGRSGGQALSHLVAFLKLRTQDKDKPPLRLMLNGIEDIGPVRDIPRHLFLHLAPLTFADQPSLYTFTKEFLGAVLYFPTSEHSTSAFDIAGEYHQVPETRSAFKPVRSQEGPREPLFDPLFIPRPFENDLAYETYWGPPIDSDEIVYPYGWQEDDEEDEEYEEYDPWNDWDPEEDGVPLQYDDDPDLFEDNGEPDGQLLDDEGAENIYPHESSEDEGPTFGDYLQTGVTVIYHDEDAFGYDEQTDVIYHDGDTADYYVETGVLYTDEGEEPPVEDEQAGLTYHGEGEYHDHGPEIHENHWLDEGVQLEEDHGNEHEEGVYEEGGAMGDDVYQEDVAEYIYPFEAEVQDYRDADDHGDVVSDDSGAGGGGYQSPGPGDDHSDYDYDSVGGGGYSDDYGYFSDGYGYGSDY